MREESFLDNYTIVNFLFLSQKTKLSFLKLIKVFLIAVKLWLTFLTFVFYIFCNLLLQRIGYYIRHNVFSPMYAYNFLFLSSTNICLGVIFVHKFKC